MNNYPPTKNNQNDSMGRHGFAQRHDLLHADHAALLADIQAQIATLEIKTIRLSFADQHGLLRGKTIMAGDLAAAVMSGATMTSSLLLKDTSHRTVFPIWADAGLAENLRGAGDFIMVPDLTTFHPLPWADHSAWLLCDIYHPDGQVVPFSSRWILDQALQKLDAKGFQYVCGLEIEFHVFKLIDPKLAPWQSGHPADPPSVQLLAHGYQYLTESREDEIEPVMELIRNAAEKLQLPIRTMEVEFGPSQCEFTFHPVVGRQAADNLVLFRSAVKQVCRRHGYHASFMCRPALANLFSCGWHLHQSLRHINNGENAFTPSSESAPLSDTGLNFVGGILQHAAACCVFSTPTINGYKRYRPYALAPERMVWAKDNKGAMIRVVGGHDDPGTRIENRVGEPAANPYLYLASQIHAGLDGLVHNINPGPPTETPYDASNNGTPDALLPTNLADAVTALDTSSAMRAAFGEQFVDYICTLKRAEFARFLSEVTDWEQREYFETM